MNHIIKNMELSGNVIVNVGANEWYPKGTERLVSSLRYTGYKGAMMVSYGLPPKSETHEQNPYSFKVDAILRALNAGYKNIFWMDSSIHCNINPNHIFEILDEHGYYFVKTGYKIGQSTNDNCLKYFGVTRDEAMEMPEIASGFWGLNFQKEESMQILNRWVSACNAGAFKGNRVHDEKDSKDPRFLFHRQDQSALSLAIQPHKLKIGEFGPLVTYDYKNPKGALFICHGM